MYSTSIVYTFLVIMYIKVYEIYASYNVQRVYYHQFFGYHGQRCGNP